MRVQIVVFTGAIRTDDDDYGDDAALLEDQLSGLNYYSDWGKEEDETRRRRASKRQQERISRTCCHLKSGARVLRSFAPTTDINECKKPEH